MSQNGNEASGNQFMTGHVEDFKVFDRAVTDDKVQEYYKQRTALHAINEAIALVTRLNEIMPIIQRYTNEAEGIFEEAAKLAGKSLVDAAKKETRGRKSGSDTYKTRVLRSKK